jgi:hypothetical protein
MQRVQTFEPFDAMSKDGVRNRNPPPPAQIQIIPKSATATEH